mmetsp:Transcript_34615/g.54036  ORF Transcript_34615/g.54036 Transcript_34615/m.54036 type:complete len:230 (+) Transcript_34615:3-692(+)
MDLMAAKGIRTFCPDMRGLGGTIKDRPGWTTPDTCTEDVKAVLDHLSSVEGIKSPSLIGWSQGALIAQLVAQRHPDTISSLVLYASIYDPDADNPKTPDDVFAAPPPVVSNNMESAMEDWTVPGLIDDEAAQAFRDEALVWDSLKASWSKLDQFNACDPAKVTTRTLVIHGEKDMYTDMGKQMALFMGISNPDKSWRVVPGCDHPVHLYPKHRQVWLRDILSFLENDVL